MVYFGIFSFLLFLSPELVRFERKVVGVENWVWLG